MHMWHCHSSVSHTNYILISYFFFFALNNFFITLGLLAYMSDKLCSIPLEKWRGGDADTNLVIGKNFYLLSHHILHTSDKSQMKSLNHGHMLPLNA